MRGWAVGLVGLTLAVPVATAHAHPADYMYTPGGEYARDIGNLDDGVGTFLQREADTPGSFTQVGHEPLMGRGMNAAIAVHKRYVYVGSRTDGKNNNANHAGVFIVDAQDPAHPFITKEMGPPYEGNARESSRELRVWRSQNVLDRPAHQLRRQRRAPVLRQPSRSGLALLRHLGRERRQPGAALPEHARHARVLHLGGPEEPEARADVRRQRGQPVPDL